MSSNKPRVLVLTLGAVGEQMSGVAIRAVEFARTLQDVAEVTLASVKVDGDPGVDVPLQTWHRHDGRTVEPLLAETDVVIAQPQWPQVAQRLRDSGSRLIYDLSVPEPLEVLETHRASSRWRRRAISSWTSDRLAGALHDGDNFLVSTDKQLDLWTGVLLAERLIGPVSGEGFDVMSRFKLVPHGLPDEPPERSDAPGVRRTFKKIKRSDEVILWNSAIWSWFDAETAIRAMAELATRRPTAKLVFMARDPDQPERIQPFEAARELARTLGVLDSHVFFNDAGVPYAERSNWLMDADVALACHRPHLETRFSFRTRYLDCFWSNLPLVVTEGDELAGRVKAENLGEVVAEKDPKATAIALERVLTRGKTAFEPEISRVANEYRWSRVAEPLINMVSSPRPPRRRGSPRRPGHAARDLTYRGARRVLNRVGIRDWPRQ